MNNTILANALITNDAVVLGLLLGILGLIFYSTKLPFFKKIYAVIPTLLFCYFVPSILNSTGLVDPEESQMYFVSSRYLLPASLVLLTLSLDLKSIKRLGPKAIIMFLAGTAGIVLGGPIALLLTRAMGFESLSDPDLWRGMATVAGSWIGGGANQTAMKEIFKAPGDLFSAMITVDVLVANVWMAVLLIGVGKSKRIDERLKADGTAIEQVKQKVLQFQQKVTKMPTLTDTMIVMAVAFVAVGIGHFLADIIAPYIGDNFPGLKRLSLNSGFFWLIFVATTIGVALSFTKARNLEGVGASRLGSFMLYVLIASIGMNMDVLEIFRQPELFLLGFIWMAIHAIVLILVGILIKAPFFFLAVGSQANVGGAASAPVVAGSFHPSLAPVGVLLAVFGYVLGTYAAYLCAILMSNL